MLDRIMYAVVFAAFVVLLATLKSTLESPLRAELEESKAKIIRLQDEIEFLQEQKPAVDLLPAALELRWTVYEVPSSPQVCLTEV